MSIGSEAIASMRGTWDVFDRAIAVIEDQVRRLRELDHEDADSMIDFYMFAGELVESGGRDELLEDLAAAKEKIDEVRLLCQRMEAALPE